MDGGIVMNINTDYIFAIIQHGSFTKAAEAVLIAQPALSRYVIRLENELGIRIFDRGKSPVVLTDEGKELVEYLNKAEALKQSFYLKLLALKDNEKHQIKLGVVPWRMPLFLPSIIPDFIEKFPNIDVTVHEDVSSNLEEMTARGELDVCVINGPAKNTMLKYTRLSKEKIELIAPVNSDFVKRNASRSVNLGSDISWEEETFVVLRKDFRLGKIAREIFLYYKKHPRNIIEVWNMSSAISMVCAGIGLTFIPSSGMPAHLPPDKRPVSFQIVGDNFTFPLLLGYKKENYQIPAVRTLLDFIHNYYPGLTRDSDSDESHND